MSDSLFLDGTQIAPKQPMDRDLVRAMCERYQISSLEATILLRRGFDQPQDLLYFLETSAIFIDSPFLFSEMPDLVDRIFSAIEEKETIAIFGDSDADGICSTVLMVEYFQSMGISPLYRVPVHSEPYGLTKEAVDAFKQENVTLIICVDNGSSAYEALAHAYGQGIDVIIIDHHSVSQRPERVYACINPHTEANYSNKTISASALVLKVLFALDFGKTAHYGRSLCFLSVTSDEENLEIETLLVHNLLPKQQKTFRLTPGSGDIENFLHSIQGLPLLTFQSGEAIELLSSFFHADVYIEDLVQLLPPQFARLKNANIDELRQNSTMLRFFPEKNSRIDFIYNLYHMCIVYNQEHLAHYWAGFDLGTIGLVADIMPMIGENRIITRIGLKVIEQKKRPALTVLLNELKLLDQKIDTKTIGWKIGPLLNASGRMGQANKAVEFLLAQEFSAQQKLLSDLSKLSQERKELTEHWFNKIYSQAQKSYEKSSQSMIFVYESSLPCGLTGLLAGRLNRLFPQTLVMVAGERNPGEVSGSLRTDLEGVILEFFATEDLLFIDHGGHQYAGGFSAESQNISKVGLAAQSFIESLKNQKQEKILTKEFDAEIPCAYFSRDLFSTVQKLSPYGEKFPVLTFLTQNVLITQIQIIGKNSDHLKLSLKFDTHICSGLWWKSSQFSEHLNVGSYVDLLYRLDTDLYLEEKKIYIIDLKVLS